MHLSAFQEALCASFQDGLPSFQDCHAIISSEASASQNQYRKVKFIKIGHIIFALCVVMCPIVFIDWVINVSDLAHVCDMGRTTVYRYINLLKV